MRVLTGLNGSPPFKGGVAAASADRVVVMTAINIQSSVIHQAGTTTPAFGHPSFERRGAIESSTRNSSLISCIY